MKKLTALFLSFVMIFTMAPISVLAEETGTEPTVVEEGFCGAEEGGTNLRWTLTEDETLTISGTGEMADYEWNSEKFESSAPWYEHKDNIKTLVLENGITHIGNRAFSRCFYLSGELVIPEGVTSIGDSAFNNTAFTGELVLPSSLEVIGSGAFISNDFEGDLVLPENLEHIFGYAFSGCEFTNVEIPAAVKTVGGGIFSDVKNNITVSEENTNYCSVDGVVFTKDATKLVCFPGGRTGDYTIPDSVITVENRAFNSSKITKIVVNENVKNINELAFEGISGNIIINGVPEIIEERAFMPYGETVNVYFMGGEPSGVAENAFCTDYDGIINLYYLKGTEDKWNFDENGLWNGYEVTPVDNEEDIPVASGYCGAEEGGTNLSWTLAADGTLTISGTGAMADFEWGPENRCPKTPWYEHRNLMKTLVLDERITRIGNYAFDMCRKLSGTLEIPESVTEIGMAAFASTGFSGELVLPDNLQYIQQYAFSGNDFTGDLLIPENVLAIEIYAFAGCDFTEISVPASCESISGAAINGCENIIVDSQNENYCSSDGVLFTKDMKELVCFPEKKGGTYTTPESVEIIGDRSFSRSEKDKITLGENVKILEELAFEDFCGSIVINSAIDEIERLVFNPFGDGELNVYFMSGEPVQVNEYAFVSDSGTINVYYREGTEKLWESNLEEPWNGFELTAIKANEIPVASGYCGGEGAGTNLRWVIDTNGTLTISGTGAMADYNDSSVIPWYEYKDNIKTLILEEGITGIGKYAFYRCTGLTGSLVIPESVTSIGQYAFSNCWNLSGKLVIPKSLVEIGNMAFSNCHGFEAVEVAGENQNYASIDDALYTKDGKTLIYYPGQKTGAYTVHEGTEVIGRMAFYNANVDSVTLPESVKTIEFKAFAHFDGKVTVKGKLDTIGGEAFSEYGEGVSIYFIGGAPLNVETGENPSFVTDTENEGQITIYYVDDGSWELDENGLWNGYKVNKINAEDVIIASGFCGAEEDGKNLSWTLTEGGTLTISGTGAMADFDFEKDSTPWSECKGLMKKLVLEQGITKIGEYAFRDCSNLSGELNIPEGVEIIGRSAFKYTSFSGKLILPESLLVISQHAFQGCNFEGSLTLPENLTDIYIYAFGDCEFTNVTVPASVEIIGGGAFSGVKEDIIVSIDNENYCSVDGILFTKDEKELVCFPGGRTGSYKTPDSVETIGDRAFASSNLNEIIVGEEIKHIEEIAFEFVDANIVICSALESIGDKAFYPDTEEEVNVYFWAGQPSGVSEYAFNEEKGTINLYYLKGTEDKWNFDSEGKWNGFEVLPYTVPEATIEISSEMIALGRNKTVLVELSENSNLEMLQFSLKYDASALKIVSCKTGALTENADINYAKAGFIDFIWDDTNVLTEGGTILEIEFTTAENAAAQKTVVELNEEKEFIAKDSDFIDVSIEVVGGEIEIVDVIYGDIDGSGKVNVIDAHLARLCAARLGSFTDRQKLAADVDGDGRVTAIDANYIRRYAIEIINRFPVEGEIPEEEPEQPEINSKKYTLGLGTIVSQSVGEKAQVDATFAAVVLDSEGKIVAVDLDIAQSKCVKTDAGIYTDEDFDNRTKTEKGPDYGMIVASPIGAEWDAQMAAFEAWAIGKTVDYIKNVETVNVNGHLVAANEVDLYAGCTIQITQFQEAIMDALNNTVEFYSDEAFELGLGVATSCFVTEASDYATGSIQMYSDYAAVVTDENGKIIAARLDAIQPKINLLADGTTTGIEDLRSKYTKKRDYGMMAASPIGSEWFEQADAYCTYLAGKTAADLEAIELVEHNGHLVALNEADLYAGCTMQVNSYIAATIKAISYAD